MPRLLKRMWINQPSSLQKYHNLDRVRVLFDRETGTIYFIDGPVHSQQIDESALSEGWPESLTVQRKMA